MQIVPDSEKPPKPPPESQCRSFLSYTLAMDSSKSLHPEAPYSNIDDIDAPLWEGKLPDNEDSLERYLHDISLYVILLSICFIQHWLLCEM